jgi:hypothetical protein
MTGYCSYRIIPRTCGQNEGDGSGRRSSKKEKDSAGGERWRGIVLRATWSALTSAAPGELLHRMYLTLTLAARKVFEFRHILGWRPKRREMIGLYIRRCRLTADDGTRNRKLWADFPWHSNAMCSPNGHSGHTRVWWIFFSLFPHPGLVEICVMTVRSNVTSSPTIQYCICCRVPVSPSIG